MMQQEEVEVSLLDDHVKVLVMPFFDVLNRRNPLKEQLQQEDQKQVLLDGKN
jgi:hypothetical protein